MSVTYSSFIDSFCEPNWRSHSAIVFDCDGAYAPPLDPNDGSDPVCLGPYFLDQNSDSSFDFHGPSLVFPGPNQFGGRGGGGYDIILPRLDALNAV